MTISELHKLYEELNLNDPRTIKIEVDAATLRDLIRLAIKARQAAGDGLTIEVT